jgi:DNA-binding response OmpR family regulator
MATRILVVDDSQTIRTLVASILERAGYETAVASDGQDAFDALVRGDVQADLVLVDFVMPRMNGYQLCQALRQHATLAELPVVLMSAKSDRIRDQFVEQTGALDAIAKPFDPNALLAVIGNALRRVFSGRISTSRLPDLSPSVSSDLETSGGISSVERLSVPATERTASALEGDLAVLPVGAILQLLQTENITGVLACRNRDVEVDIAFRQGVIDLVQSKGMGDEYRLGRFFVESGILTAEEIDAMLTRSQEEPRTLKFVPKEVSSSRDLAASFAQGGRPLGIALLDAGKIDHVQLRAALVRQSSELLYEVLRWPAGRFELRRDPPGPLADSARLGLPVASVVMEGFRRIDEWRALEQRLGSFEAVLVRDDAAFGSLDVQTLPQQERSVLFAVDGNRTVQQVLAASGVSSFDACRIVVQFLEARTIRRRSV